jgi:predicted nucleotidyltransferase
MLTAAEFGLQERHLLEINSILQKYPEIEKAVIFGSRATKTNKHASDIDLALWFTSDISYDISKRIISKVIADFEESRLPYFVDVIDYINTDNNVLRTNIDRDGKLIYSSL